MEYDCIIIGAGVGGLSAGLKLSTLGKKILLLEKQPVPGGFATTFSRKGFIFESAIHCVDELSPGGWVRGFLEKHNIDKKIEFIELKDFARIIYPGHDFVADFNPDHFLQLLVSKFPQEEAGLHKLFSAFDKFFRQFDRFSESPLPDVLNLLISPFVYPFIINTSTCSIGQFVRRYISDKKLNAIITDLWRFMGLPPDSLSALYFLIVFRGYYYHHTAYIKGGFGRLFQAMVEEIGENGGQSRFNTAVKKIITQKGRRVKSVITDQGEEFRAKTIISNANAIDTLTEFIDQPLLASRYRKKLSAMEKSVSAFQIYLGLDQPAQNFGMSHHRISVNPGYDHRVSFDAALRQDYSHCLLELTDHSQLDPSLVPKGKGSLVIMTYDLYANWANLNPQDYKKRKMEVVQSLIKCSEKYLPGLSKHIEVLEAATPRTMQRYVSSPQGAIYGFSQTIAQAGINRLSQKTAIHGLFLTGGWTFPGGGVHACFVSGESAADLALKLLK
ncbi:MAG: NAD(P)/FAD-dependent oxidoreductase [Candidatus Omnitrophica bacterium]|nr:NAD(P)/FAD-dependent oxidoreductase [Candidatus Omnitrophota bacterium]MDD5653792.1 NAD(P)/FAD-dependent oxidoreductase [Candidatus Omnitrophota bacterium]